MTYDDSFRARCAVRGVETAHHEGTPVSLIERVADMLGPVSQPQRSRPAVPMPPLTVDEGPELREDLIERLAARGVQEPSAESAAAAEALAREAIPERSRERYPRMRPISARRGPVRDTRPSASPPAG